MQVDRVTSGSRFASAVGLRLFAPSEKISEGERQRQAPRFIASLLGISTIAHAIWNIMTGKTELKDFLPTSALGVLSAVSYVLGFIGVNKTQSASLPSLSDREVLSVINQIVANIKNKTKDVKELSALFSDSKDLESDEDLDWVGVEEMIKKGDLALEIYRSASQPRIHNPELDIPISEVYLRTNPDSKNTCCVEGILDGKKVLFGLMIQGWPQGSGRLSSVRDKRRNILFFYRDSEGNEKKYFLLNNTIKELISGCINLHPEVESRESITRRETEMRKIA